MLEDWTRKHKLPSHPVRIAAEAGHTSIVELLLHHGASAPVAMAGAAKHGQAHVVKVLLDTYPASEDALLKSALGGYTTVARMLLDKGADTNVSLEERVAKAEERVASREEDSLAKEKSPLVYAIEKENTDLFKLLVKRGARLDLLGTAEECVKQAQKDGLESMLALLKEYAVEVME